MAWRRYPIEFIWQEMDEMRAEPDNMVRGVLACGRLLPAGGQERPVPGSRDYR